VRRKRGPQLLRIYAGLTLKYEILLANVKARYGDNLLDELGHAVPALETLQRLEKACASIGAQLGLSPAAERALRYNAGVAAAHKRWTDLADDEVVEPVPVGSSGAAPAPETANDTPAC
jgi:hypothetical protein